MTLRRRFSALLAAIAGAGTPDAADAIDEPPPEAPPVAGPGPAPAPPAAPATPRDRDAEIRQVLEICARSFVPAGRLVRANVMTFSADRQRRSVQRATAFNMADDPDGGLEIGATAGASGKAVMFRRATVADLTLLHITDVPPWGLTADQQSQVRPRLKSILSVPIFDPADPKGPLLGTLQVDSDLSVEQAGFTKPEAAELTQQFADVLSLLMTGVNVRLGEAEVPDVSPMTHSRVQNATQVEPGMYVANASTSIFLISRPPQRWEVP